ncbi:MAG: type II toxin-antitoxin system HicB family antitoxin [Caldisericia bacterium]|nr:type II toxin-antitoxin system HicB family antitoxin [Caldisericia bacterium]MDD4663093.1 type II toxin-antitoxin system HicB family antitoxin [Caldisericia bacterium]
MKYPVYIEKDKSSEYGVVVSDLPGCYSAGSTFEEALTNAEEAILTHLEGLMMDDDPIPMPSKIDELQSKQQKAKGVWALVEVDIKKVARESKRINVTIPSNILAKIDAFTEKTNESRSGLLSKAALEYIAQHQK